MVSLFRKLATGKKMLISSKEVFWPYFLNLILIDTLLKGGKLLYVVMVVNSYSLWYSCMFL